jgi:hypothetical protein
VRASVSNVVSVFEGRGCDVVPSQVDLQAKRQALGDALEIVKRDVRAHKAGQRPMPAQLAEGTSYEVVPCEHRPAKTWEDTAKAPLD